jgi:FkbM family methyltransferase
LIHYHVGGRAGSTSLDVPAAFAEDMVVVLFDADENCVALSETLGRKGRANTTSVPYYVGRREEEVLLHLNYDPFTSSSYEINPYFADYYANVGGADYVLGEVAAPLSEVKVASHSLDGLCLGDEATLEPPDVLTLDTQASELDILEGASHLLDENVLAIVSEVQFNEVYRGGPLFGDISAFLLRKGFLFAEFHDISRFAPFRGRIGNCSEGLSLFADAVFLRDPQRIAEGWGERADPALRKLAFLALCHQQLEFAQFCLRLCRTPAPADGPVYLRFLVEFATACATLPGDHPWTYVEAYSPNSSRALTEPASESETAQIKAEMVAKAAREAGKQQIRAAGAVADLLERYGFAFAPRVRRFQELVLQAYRDSIAHWAAMARAPSDDPGKPRG